MREGFGRICLFLVEDVLLIRVGRSTRPLDSSGLSEDRLRS